MEAWLPMWTVKIQGAILDFEMGGFRKSNYRGIPIEMHDFRLDTTDFPAQMDHYTSPYWTLTAVC